MINEDRICFGENCQNRLTLEDSLFQSQADQNEFQNLFLAEVHAKHILSPHLSDPHCQREDKLSIWIVAKGDSCLADHLNCLSRVSLCHFGTFLYSYWVL